MAPRARAARASSPATCGAAGRGPRQRLPPSVAAALRTNVSETLRARARPAVLRPAPTPARPFVYFPLHVTDDYKISKVIPHCDDQASLVEQVADALPPGTTSSSRSTRCRSGATAFRLLRRLRKRPNVQLVEPYTNTHDLIRRGRGGRRHLLDRRPRGAALREAGADARAAVLLRLRGHARRRLVRGDPRGSAGAAPLPARPRAHPPLPPRRDARAATPGAPVLVDRSDDNARRLAGSLEETAARAVAERAAVPA